MLKIAIVFFVFSISPFVGSCKQRNDSILQSTKLGSCLKAGMFKPGSIECPYLVSIKDKLERLKDESIEPGKKIYVWSRFPRNSLVGLDMFMYSLETKQKSEYFGLRDGDSAALFYHPDNSVYQLTGGISVNRALDLDIPKNSVNLLVADMIIDGKAAHLVLGVFHRAKLKQRRGWSRNEEQMHIAMNFHDVKLALDLNTSDYEITDKSSNNITSEYSANPEVTTPCKCRRNGGGDGWIHYEKIKEGYEIFFRGKCPGVAVTGCSDLNRKYSSLELCLNAISTSDSCKN